MWSLATVIVPITVAVIALAISLLSYRDQHQADAVAVTASERQDAEQVTYWLQHGPKHAKLMLQDRSGAPIYDVHIYITLFSFHGYQNAKFFLRNVPPCSVGDTNVMNLMGNPVLRPVMTNKSKAVTYLAITFTDASGISWKRDQSGVLEKDTGDGNEGPHTGGATEIFPQFKPTDGCS